MSNYDRLSFICLDYFFVDNAVFYNPKPESDIGLNTGEDIRRIRENLEKSVKKRFREKEMEF